MRLGFAEELTDKSGFCESCDQVGKAAPTKLEAISNSLSELMREFENECFIKILLDEAITLLILIAPKPLRLR